MELVWLQDFVALAEAGGFSRAARLRNVTQPAFSRRVRALEEWIGTPLFERTSRGVILTPAGEVFARSAPDLLLQIRSLRARTREAGGGGETPLQFAATQTLSFSFFPDWIRRASDLELGHVQLNTANMAVCEEIMRAGRAEFLLCHGHPSVEDPFAGEFPSIRVGEDRLVAVQGRRPDGSHPLPPEKRAAWPYLAYGEATGIGRILSACEPALVPEIVRETVFTSHLSAALRSLALDGAGMAWLPLSLVRGDLAAGRLVRLFDERRDIPVDILLFRAPELGASAQRFWESLRVEAGAVGPSRGAG